MRLKLLPRPRFNRDQEGVSRIIKLMIPTLFAVSITQINLLVDTLIASFLQTGSISWLYYSDRLVELEVGRRAVLRKRPDSEAYLDEVQPRFAPIEEEGDAA